MKKILAAALCLLSLATAFAQQQPTDEEKKAAEERRAKLEAEEREYYANADTALYGVRYRFHYLYNKARGLSVQEDRVVLVRPEVTLDRSYEGIGEMRWRNAHPDQKGGGDPTLAYHLTPDYYFFYPETGRQAKVYRMISEEFLLSDTTCTNMWNITDRTSRIGEYNCRMAYLDKDGRRWEAWYTNDLPYSAAPRHFNGLPGVVIAMADTDQEVIWNYNGIVRNLPDSRLYIKYPDRLKPMSPDTFRKAVRIVALSDMKHLQEAGVWDMNPKSHPSRLRPSTGIDALNIDNPIER